jgi:hypothetical protein
MSRNLNFILKGQEYAAKPVKVDRSKLYGWTALKALCDDGSECSIVSMEETGSLVIPKGGMGMGMLSPEGEWVERSSLKAIKADGSPAEPVPSSFSAPIELQEIVDAETFLDHKINLVYQLDGAAELISAMGDDIYCFNYSFRDSFKGDPAFILASGNSLFMLIGEKLEFEMLSLAQAETVDDDDDSDEEEDDSDDLDFSMM